MQFALCWTLIWGLRRAFGSLLVAALVAVPVAAAIWQEPTLVIAFTAAVALTAGRASGRGAQAIALGLGALCGFELLAKLNAGITLSLFARDRAAWPRRGRGGRSRLRWPAVRW